MNSKPLIRNVLIQFILSLLFFCFYYALYSIVESPALSLLSIIFVSSIAWLRGTLPGLLQCAFNFAIIHITLNSNITSRGTPPARDAIIGLSMHIIFTLAAGYVGSLTRRLNKEIEERKRVETLLNEHRKQLELRVEERTRELEDASQKLHQAEKMETIGQLAGGLAHDFKNHLTVINGYANLLVKKLSQSPQESSFLQHIITSSEHAGDLTSNLLNFSRKERYKPQLLDINEIINQTVSLFSKCLFSRITIECSLTPDLPKVLGGKSQIQNAILNLALNAKDAISSNQGSIYIETKSFTVAESFIKQHNLSCKPGSYTGIIVSDNGCGIAPEVLPQIFDPFFTTKPEGRGTGMGLATIQGMTRQHKGDVFATSQIGTGTSFTILLPVYAPASEK